MRGRHTIDTNLNELEKPRSSLRVLADAKAHLVITCAGVSAESGLPAFRGSNGLYATSVDTLASVLYFLAMKSLLLLAAMLLFS